MLAKKEDWNGLAQRVLYRQTAVNILKNHFASELKVIKLFEEKYGSMS